MLRLRARLASLATRTGVSRLALSAKARLPRSLQHLTIMAWHRVADGLGAGFDPKIVDASVSQFDRQVAILKESFSLIDTSDLVKYREERGTLPPNPALLTFDDGYRENLTVVLPILKKHKAKAVFFIPTEYMEERKLFTWELIHLMVQRCRRAQISITYPVQATFQLGDGRARSKAAEALSHTSRSYQSIDWRRFLAELAKACEVEVDAQSERAMADELLLDWEGVRNLVGAGMDVQSHGHAHSLYEFISPEAILSDASCSKRLLEEKAGVPQVALAYPAGSCCQRGTAGYAAVEQAGYKLGFRFNLAASRLGAISDWLQLSRLCAEPSWSEAEFRGILAFPNSLGY